MKIGVAKIGKSMKFRTKSWKGIGGDHNIPLILRLLALQNPQNEYHILSRTDFNSLSEEELDFYSPNRNIIADIEKFPFDDIAAMERFKKIVDAKKLDKFLFSSGPQGNTNIPGFLWNKDKGKFLVTLDSFRTYCGPLVYLLNKTTTPVVWLLQDERYRMRARDLIAPRQPTEYLSQYDNQKFKTKCVEDMVFSKKKKTVFVKSLTKYAAIETFFLCGRKKLDIDTIDEQFKKKENILRIILHQGVNGKFDRYPYLMKYIGKWGTSKCIKNIEIYGHWEQKIMDKDPRFKGVKSFTELKELLGQCKASIIIPTSKGWATNKVYEMMNLWQDEEKELGVLPLMAPEYDSQNHMLPKDHFLRVTPATFREKLQKIFTDDDFCKELYRDMYTNYMKPEFYSGEYLNGILTKELEGAK